MIYIGIGSNLGHRLYYLQQALEMLGKRGLRDISCSMVLETECLLLEGSPPSWNKPFLNMVVAGKFDSPPDRLLAVLKEIEREIGRPEQYEKWAPRVIDLDILLWDGITIDTPQLKIPHPELMKRPFLTHLLGTMGIRQYQQAPPSPCFIKSLVVFPRLVGIVNVTEDSFSDGQKFAKTSAAIAHALKLAEDGATVIDIGAQSTRPGAILHSPGEEYARLAPVLDGLKSLFQDKAVPLSIDSFQPFVIRKILKTYPVAWINDVKGNLDDETLKLILAQGCRLCIMHSLSIPADKKVTLPANHDPLEAVLAWAQRRVEHLQKIGFKKENIIVDPGIGFGKSAYQSMEILRRLEELRPLGTPILIGHSRKSFMESFTCQGAALRDIESLAVSALVRQKADFLRVHNVADHMRFFVAGLCVGEDAHVS